jgi:RNase H-fold protein (predicted Holliday junction resolvase)
VEMVDERLTSWEAERLLEEQAGKIFREDAAPAHVRESAHSNVRKKKQAERATVDAMAAAVILKEYLERKQNPGTSI